MGEMKVMFLDQDLPMHLQEKEAKNTMYVQNHTPHRVLHNKTPEENFSEVKPEVRNMTYNIWFPSVHTCPKG